MPIHLKTKTSKLLGCCIVFFVLLMLIATISALTDPARPKAIEAAKTESAKTQVTEKDITEAKKELEDFMKLSTKAGLVISYEFSKSANVVYVSSVWYTQTVPFKKDFIAKVAMLKKPVTGYAHFEVLDGYSNEKVAEVTSFTQSLEIYK